VCLAETLPGGPEDYLKPTVYSGTGIWSVKNTDPKYRASSVESNNRVQLIFLSFQHQGNDLPFFTPERELYYA